MSRPPGTLCFTCGQPTSDPPRFNHLPSGQPCPACRDRLLESLPPLLPGEPAEVVEPEEEPEPARAPGPRRTRSRSRRTD